MQLWRGNELKTFRLQKRPKTNQLYKILKRKHQILFHNSKMKCKQIKYMICCRKILKLSIRIHFSIQSRMCMCPKMLQSCRLCITPWTVDDQEPLSIGFSRQEYCSGLPCLLPGDLPNPGIEPPAFLTFHILAGRFITTSATWEAVKTTRRFLPRV